MTELERALTHIKTRADAWAVKEIEKALTLEPKMTLDEAIKHAEEVADSRCDKCGQEHAQLAEWLKELKAYKEQEPCDAQERYEDLCEYFGDAKDILKNREDFKAWLDRIKWHIHKAEELAAENDDLRDQLAMRDRFQKQEPCTDAVSREVVYRLVDDIIDNLCENSLDLGALESWGREQVMNIPSVTQLPAKDYLDMADRKAKKIKDALTDTQKSGKWISISEPPKELGTYLIQTDGEPYMCQCRWTDVNPFWTDLKTKPHWNIFDLPQYSKVVAWMPLPKPYELQESEEQK